MALDFLRELDRFEPTRARGDRLAVLSSREHTPMPQITESFRESEFERFVRSYGVDLMAERLAIKPSAIYHWLRGATAPTPIHAETIQRLARERGAMLTMDQIYRHFLSRRAPEVTSEQLLEASAGAARPAARLDSQWK